MEKQTFTTKLDGVRAAIESRCIATMTIQKKEWATAYNLLGEDQKKSYWDLWDRLEEVMAQVKQENLVKRMLTEGEITLPNGQTIVAGQGGSDSIGSDIYPITIIGWNKSGKMLYYRSAKLYPTANNPSYQHEGETKCLFVDDTDAEIKVATWRHPSKKAIERWECALNTHRVNPRPGKKEPSKPMGCYRPKGCSHGRIGTARYIYNLDPSF